MPSSYGGVLTFNSPVFDRPEGNIDYYYHFQALQVTVSTSGTYIFTSNSDIDTRGYFYQTSFDPSDPTMNLVIEDDDSSSYLQFRIQVYLQSGRTYILVVTTHREYAVGSFSVSAIGPASVSFMSITASTSRPIITRKFLITLKPNYSNNRYKGIHEKSSGTIIWKT